MVAFYGLLWFLTISWLWPQVLLVLVTYSEIQFTSMRFFALFALVVIAEGFQVAIRAVYHALASRRAAPVLVVAGSLATGTAFYLAWKLDAPSFRILGPLLSALGLVATVVSLCRLRGWIRTAPSLNAGPGPGLALTTAAFAAFAAPAWVGAEVPLVRNLAFLKNDPAALFASGNPFDLSPSLIGFMRTGVPPREIVAIDPLGRHFANVYAPIYIRPYPIGYIIPDLPEVDAARAGNHPLFNNRLRRGVLDPRRAEEYVSRTGVRWILGSGSNAIGLRALAAQRPTVFQVAYESDAGEVVLHARPIH
jgi:hypothetical protein